MEHVEPVRFGSEGMRVEDLLKAKGRDVETDSARCHVVTVSHGSRRQGIGALVVSTDGTRRRKADHGARCRPRRQPPRQPHVRDGGGAGHDARWAELRPGDGIRMSWPS